MKKELLKIKLQRLAWALVFSIIFLAPMLAGFIIVWGMITHFGAPDTPTPANWGGIIAGFIVMLLVNKAWDKPSKWIHSVFFAPKLEDLDNGVKMITEAIRAKRIEKLTERDDILQSKIEIIEELKDFTYTLDTTNILRNISQRVNDIHANEPNNKNVIDIRDLEINKREFKKFKKDVIANVGKVRVSRLNADKLKDIEEIITGKAAKQQQLSDAEHRKAIEIAKAGAQQNVVIAQPSVYQAPVDMLESSQTQSHVNSGMYLESNDKIEVEDESTNS